MPNPGDLEAGLRQVMRERENGTTLEETSRDHSSDSLQHLATSTATPAAPTMRQRQSNHLNGMTPLGGDEDNSRLTPTSSPEMQHISRTPSDGSVQGQSTPPQVEVTSPIDMGRLSRVPSYNTANASNLLNLDPISQALPTYACATSSLPTIAESRSRAGSSASSQSSDAQRRSSPTVTGPSGDGPGGLYSAPRAGGVYGSPHIFDDPMRRISIMRNMFSNR
jgi:hypothetical protein